MWHILERGLPKSRPKISTPMQKDPLSHKKRKDYLFGHVFHAILLFILFFGNLSWFFGSASDIGVNVHHLKVVLVDYDGGIVADALHASYDGLKGDSFPTIEVSTPTTYPTPDELQHHFCMDKSTWGALYIHAGASSRLSLALQNSTFADEYNPSDAFTCIWNGVRYSEFGSSAVATPMSQLIVGAGVALANINQTYIYDHLNTSSPASISILAQPFVPVEIDIMPTNQGVKVFYNTVTIALVCISQFFYIMITNHISEDLGLFAKFSVTKNLCIRWINGFIYSCLLAAAVTGVIWTFKDKWPVTASQGVETWLVLCFICNIHFFFFDFGTGFIPVGFLFYFVLTWVLINVTATIVPLELAPGFYHWQYAMPSYETYQLLITVWSHGCDSSIDIALPVLFTWWILGFAGSWLSMKKKCSSARGVQSEASSQKDDLEKGPE